MLWLPSDRTKVLAVLLERAATCKRCGTRRDQWFKVDPATGEERLIHPPPFRAVDFTDHGCEMLDHALENVKDPVPGQRWTLEPRLSDSRTHRDLREG